MLTERAASMAAWDSIPEAERPFQRRLMEVFAGFVEHADTQVGRLVDGLDEMGLRDNTLIFYIFGGNGSSAEAPHHGRHGDWKAGRAGGCGDFHRWR